MSDKSRNDPPVDTGSETTESQILRGADTGGDDTDFSLRGDSGESGLDEDEDLVEAIEINRAEELEDL